MRSPLLVLCLLYLINAAQADGCQLREYPTGYVCVCNTTYCDSFDIDEPKKFGEYLFVSSTKSGQRFHVTKGKFVPKPNSTSRIDRIADHFHPTVIRIGRNARNSRPSTITLTVNREKKYQSIVGFGGAFTGTVSYLLELMPSSLRKSFYRNYYSRDEGIAYSMMRIPIGGCDFDLEPWAYNESPSADTRLTNFTRLDPRDLNRIDQINDLKQISQNMDIKLLGTAWSPPRWMKTNNRWSGFATLEPEFYQAWADYHLRYLRLMAYEDVHYWGITTGNEPLNGEIGWMFIHFMSLGWLPEAQGKWIGENLGPTLNNSQFADVKLFAGDDQRYTYPWWFDRMKNGASNALDFISGFAMHWYWDKVIPPQLIDQTHAKYPDKILLNTESSVGDKPWETHSPILGSWSRGEKYALAMIEDLQHYVSGWIDWNLILDETGGPSYVNNTVDAAVILNTTNYREFYKQPIFYVIAHFSKFIPPDSIRIESTLTGFRSGSIKTVAFLRPDQTIVIILYNKSDKSRIISFTDDLRGSYELELQPRSINSFVFA